MTPYGTIRAEVHEPGIGVLTLSRPDRRNAISIRMRREISGCLDAWSGSGEVRAAIVTGAGPVFSGGFDLAEFRQPERFDELLDSSSRYHRDVWRFPKPLVAAVNGPAMGGGFDLAVLCDLRIGTPAASFGHPEVKFGAPPLVTPLRWIVGDGHARDLALTGRTIRADEALRIGLVGRIVEADRLMDEAFLLAKSILEAPAETLSFLKGCLAASGGRDFEESFRVEHDVAFRDILLPRARKGL
ncbi:MAG: enoyl-CoA hydratase/isomerase family protein [Gemmatimonadota bacterium]